MSEEPRYPGMDTQIFNLSLSVPAISAYILICSLVGDGTRPNWAILRQAWVGPPEDLDPSMAELLAWQVIDTISNAEGQEHFWPNPASLWRLPGTLN
jgi:hypothetical protein